MILNLKLSGVSEYVVNSLVKQGVAENKTEAVRIMIMHYNEHFKIKSISEYTEAERVLRKIEDIEQEVKEGKRKTITMKEFLKNHPELRDG